MAAPTAGKCWKCKFDFSAKHDIEYHYACSISADHSLCDQCGDFWVAHEVHSQAEESNRDLLYFVWSDDKLHGPVSISEITAMYIKKELSASKMFVMKANNEKEWVALTLPKSESDLKDDDPKRRAVYTECKDQNKAFIEKYPDLHRALIGGIFANKLQRIDAPEGAPQGEGGTSLSLKVTKVCGVALAIFLTVVLCLHCLGSIPFMCCVMPCLICAAMSLDDNSKTENSLWMSAVVCMIAGILICPILVVYLSLETGFWDEIQSWMVSYVVWGFFTFLIPLVFLGALAFENESLRKSIMSNITLVIGVDFGNFDLDDAKEWSGVAIIFLFPCLAALLPAAVCGFIANFALEKKFELKCSEDITDSDICFDDSFGCCEVISSHELTSSYEFLGGLASNILATWALIRIGGYLLINAFPDLALYGKRKA